MPRRVATGQRTYINNIVVTGYQKRKSPSKHYVFVVDLVWDNDERYEIVRRYSEFFSLQESLKSVFPDAVRVGKNADERTTLPELPGRIFLGRSHVAKVAEARLESINQYCQALIRMDRKISHCSYVIQFFSPQPGDKALPKLRLHRPASLHPMKRPAGNLFEEHCVIAQFEAEGPGQISVQSGDQVLVLAKDNSGWWMIEFKKQVGWVPSSYLKKCPKLNEEEDVLGLVGSYSDNKPATDNADSGVETDSSSNSISSRSSTPPGVEIDAEEYLAIDSYVACGPGQIGFEEGEVITVLDKMEDGWWFVTKGEEDGWCPCGYLEPLNKTSSDDETVPISSLDAEKYLTIADYTAEEDDEISFPAGVVAEVLQKSLTGWWMVRCQDTIGCAPATYLRKIREESEEEKPASPSVETSPFSGGALNSSFRQVPRQKTVRHKRSQKQNKHSANPATVGREDENSQPAQKQKDSASPRPRPRPKRSSNTAGELDERQRKDSSPKPPIVPRSNGLSDNSQQTGSPKPATKAKPGQPSLSPSNSLLGLQTPPRPRQSQIVRARDYSPQRQESLSLMPDTAHDRSPSPVFEHTRKLSQGRPNRRKDGSPRCSPGTQRKSSSSESDVKTPPTHINQFPVHAAMAMVMAGGISANNPFSQQLADSIVQYIVASDNPELVEVLRKAVDGNPEAKKVLGRQ